MARLNFWGKVLVGLKAFVSGVITSIIISPLTFGTQWLMAKARIVPALLVGIVALFLGLYLFGFFSNKFWGWK